MTGETDDFEHWSGPLTKDELRAINQLVIRRVIDWCDDTPFKDFDTRTEGDWTKREHAPVFRSNRLFPTHGVVMANEVATLLAMTAAGRDDLGDLRLITLRLGGDRPEFGKISDHLGTLSKAASKAAEDVQRPTKDCPSGIARPILTTIHLRLTDDEQRFDPHIHGIWDIAAADIEKVRERLQDKFGQVWIDSVPVRSLRRAAFYIAQGIIDYRRLPTWPREAFRAVWRLDKFRMFRKAGWFASESSAAADVSIPESERAPEAVQEALGGPVQADQVSDHTEALVVPPEAIGGVEAGEAAHEAWRGSLFPFMRPYRPSISIQQYTVHPVSSENDSGVDLNRYPTLGDIQATAIAVVESEQRDMDRLATDVFGAYGLNPEQVLFSVDRVETYFHLTIFHKGIRWVPTASGVAWATTTMAALELLRQAAAPGMSELKTSHRDTGRLPQHLRRT